MENQPFTGGLDTSEPWQGQWNGGVLVECVGRPEQSRTEAQVNPNKGSACCLLLPDIFIKTNTILEQDSQSITRDYYQIQDEDPKLL